VVNDTEDLDALAAEYVLGSLDDAERTAAEARLLADGGFRARVAAWQQRLQPLADIAAPVEPPAGLRERILAGVGGEGQGTAQPAGNVVALRRQVRRWQAGTGIAVAAAVVLAVVLANEIARGPGAPQTEFVAMLTPDGGKPAFILTVDTVKNPSAASPMRRRPTRATSCGRSSPARIRSRWALSSRRV
jgi:anti-sigma-K factor RskA